MREECVVFPPFSQCGGVAHVLQGLQCLESVAHVCASLSLTDTLSLSVILHGCLCLVCVCVCVCICVYGVSRRLLGVLTALPLGCTLGSSLCFNV